MDYHQHIDVSLLSQSEHMTFTEYMAAVPWETLTDRLLAYGTGRHIQQKNQSLLVENNVDYVQEMTKFVLFFVTHNRCHSELAAPAAMAGLLGLLEAPNMPLTDLERLIDFGLMEDTLGTVACYGYHPGEDNHNDIWTVEELEVTQEFMSQSRELIEHSRNQATADTAYFANHIGQFYSLFTREHNTERTIKCLCFILKILGRSDILALFAGESIDTTYHQSNIDWVIKATQRKDSTIQRNAHPLVQAIERAVLIPLAIDRDNVGNEQMAHEHVVPLSLWDEDVSADALAAVVDRVIKSRRSLFQQTPYIDDLYWTVTYLPQTHELVIRSTLMPQFIGAGGEAQTLQELAQSIIFYGRSFDSAIAQTLPGNVPYKLLEDKLIAVGTHTPEIWLYNTRISANQFDRAYVQQLPEYEEI